MSDLRDAARQALVDMACVRDMVAHPDNLQFIDKAITALRAALEQPEPFQPDWDRIEPLQEALREHMAEIHRLRAELDQQDKQKPVLIVEKEPSYWSRGHYHEGHRPHIDPLKVLGLPIGTKLFAAPQQAAPAQPLTREKSPTADMTVAQRILHVGGRNNAAGYVEFGSTQAVEALVRQVLRDIPQKSPIPDYELVTMYDERPSSDAEMIEFARAVEAAHGIGEVK